MALREQTREFPQRDIFVSRKWSFYRYACFVVNQQKSLLKLNYRKRIIKLRKFHDK